MNKQNILNEAVSDMVEILHNLNLENIDRAENEVKTYFSFLKTLTSLRTTIHSMKQDEKDDLEKIESQETEIKEDEKEENCYRMKRNLKGGWLDGINVYVPERIVREYGLEEGDLVSAVQIADKYYKYQLVEKTKIKQPTNREELNYCILTKQNSYLVASEYWEKGLKKMIKHDDAPHTFLINDETILKYNLTEGSIVDIAFKKDNINDFKVIWKHDIDSIPHTKPLPSSFYKEKPDKEEPIQTNELSGKKVLLLGGQRTLEFVRAIENIGGELTHADDSTSSKRLESMVKNCDVLVIMIYHIGHIKAEKAKELAKKYEKRFTVMESRGISNLVETTKAVVNS